MVVVIDHVFLCFELIFVDIEEGCVLVARFYVGTVCCCLMDIVCCGLVLVGMGVGVIIVIGFLYGVNVSVIKVVEGEWVLVDGVVELDMVLFIGLVWGCDRVGVEVDIVVVVVVVGGYLVKVILEIGYLMIDEIVLVAYVAEVVGVDFVKIFIGYGSRNVIVEDVCLLRVIVLAWL